METIVPQKLPTENGKCEQESAGSEQGKHCKRCHQWFPFSGFHSNRSNKDGMHRWCKKCNNDYKKDNKKYVPEKVRVDNWKKKFGITPERYSAMLAEQGGVCAICKEPEVATDHRSGLPRMLAVDHDHETGDIRALLCAKCNMTLGRMREDPVRIRTLTRYAEWCQTRKPFDKFI